MRNVQSLGPIVKAKRDAMVGEKPIARRVSALFETVSPSTIGRFVIAIVIYSINRLAGWFRSHVGKEILEPHPRPTDLNTSSAVFGESVIRWIKTSLLHRVPGHIRRRLTKLRSAVMGNSANFVVKTAAASCGTRFKRVGNHPFLITANAEAEPIHSVSATLLCFTGNSQSSEHLSGQIFGSSVFSF